MIKWIRYHYLITTCVLISTIIGSLSPLNAAPGQWTWMWGDKDKGMDYSTVYGTEGIPSPDNYPLRRDLTSRWTEPNGDMWMYGGRYFDTGSYNAGDLWKYDAGLNQWAFYGGSKSGSYEGNYGEKGVASASNLPPVKSKAFTWTDSSGKLWMFGGAGLVSLPTSSPFLHNDIWNYDKSTRMWTWVAGPQTRNSTGTYGTKGVESDLNYPGARFAGTSWYNVAENSVYIFGGYGYGSSSSGAGQLNDLWKYNLVNGKWTWISGSQQVGAGAAPQYGQQGIENSSNIPEDAAVRFLGREQRRYLSIWRLRLHRFISGRPQ